MTHTELEKAIEPGLKLHCLRLKLHYLCPKLHCLRPKLHTPRLKLHPLPRSVFCAESGTDIRARWYCHVSGSAATRA
eukprot:636256-Rhodomonas_salina.1